MLSLSFAYCCLLIFNAKKFCLSLFFNIECYKDSPIAAYKYTMPLAAIADIFYALKGVFLLLLEGVCPVAVNSYMTWQGVNAALLFDST